MRRSKFLIFSLMFALIALFALGLNVNVKATTGIEGTGTDSVSVAGAKIRTAGTAGIRFVAEISEDFKEGATKYGVALAFGEADASEILVNGTVNDKNVLTGEIDAATLEEGATEFYVNLINIPNTMYGQKITARAYVVKDEEYHYANTTTTRSLGEVVLKANAAGEVAGNEFLEGIYAEVANGYKSVFTLPGSDYVFVNGTVYETNPTKLGLSFVADWNAKFGTEFTEYSYSTWATSAKAGYGEGTGMTANGDTDCSGTNAYEFFITDEATSAKWGWLLDFLLDNKGSTVHPNRQIQALRNGGSFSDSYGGGLQQFAHLSRSLQNFFDAEGTDVYGSGIDVIIKDFSVYGTIANYNNTVLAIEPTLIKVGESVSLNNLSKTGYTFDGYNDGAANHKDEYVLTTENVVLIPQFTAIDYTITYYNGENEIVDLAYEYSIESALTLPSYELEGYEFLGWYDNPEFSGNAITEIIKGTYGDKVFYAKMEESKAKVEVTFDTAGGYLAMYPSVDAAIADFLTDYNTARGKSHTPATFYELGSWGEISDASLFLYNVNYKAKWTWLVNYIAGVASNANKVAFETFFDYTTQAELNAANSNNIYRIAYELRGWVGQAQYTKNGNFVTADYSSAAVKAAYVAAVTLPNTYEYSDPCTLPTPIKENHTFLGWEDSEGNAVTEFPGSDVVSEAITYTATWEANYASVNVTFDANGGHLPMACDPNTKVASTYNNVGGASGTYFCDTSITSNNSLRWQYKVLLQYDEELNAYKVVCLDAAKASANNAASAAGVTWTHALSNSGSNISTQYTVGQYIVFENTPVKGANNLSYFVANSAEEIAAYQYPTTYSKTFTAPAALSIIPVKDGYTFVGWKSSVDGSVGTEYPGYAENPGTVTYTAQWEIAE